MITMTAMRILGLIAISALFAAPDISRADRKLRSELSATKASSTIIARGNSEAPSLAIARGLLVVGAGANAEPTVRFIDPASGIDLSPPFLAASSEFMGGVRVASGDVDGDGAAEVILALGRGSAPDVTILSRDGDPKGTFAAFEPSFMGGVTVAAGDLDGDGTDEIITASNGIVRARSGERFAVVAQFQPYGAAFTDGPAIAAGDLDGDGIAEIITAPLSGGGAVRAFDARDRIFEVFPFGFASESGTNVAAGDIDGDGRAEAIVGAAKKPRLAALSSSGETVLELRPIYRGGVSVAVGDIDGDGANEIVTVGKISKGKRKRRKLFDSLEVYVTKRKIRRPKVPRTEEKGRPEKGPRAVDFSPAIP